MIAQTDIDLWGVQEIVSATQFQELLTTLDGVDGFLANDPTRVPNGANWYSEFELKLGVLFRSDRLMFLGK